MNINDKDKDLLKRVKSIVEKISKEGKLPNTLEGITELYNVWNEAYKRNDRVNNCPSCRQTKFQQLKRTYDVYDLENQFNKKAPAKKKATKK